MKGIPSTARQRLRKYEETVARTQQCQAGGTPERQPRTDIAEHTAESRSQHEPDTERGSDKAERAGSLLGRSDVGDVREGRTETGGANPGRNAPDQQPADTRRERHHDVIQPEAEA